MDDQPLGESPDLDGYLRQVRDELLDAREYVLDELNDYDGDNVWGEVILRMAGYDEAATDAAAAGGYHDSDVAVIGGTTYVWDQRDNRWAVSSDLADQTRTAVVAGDLRVLRSDTDDAEDWLALRRGEVLADLNEMADGGAS